MNAFRLGCAVLALALLTGCIAPTRLGPKALAHDSPAARARLAAAAPATAGLPTDTPAEITLAYRFAPGDELSVRVYSMPQYDLASVIVDQDGKVRIPGAGAVRAAGRSVDELRADLESAFASELRHPQVSVRPVRVVGHRYYVLGKVGVEGAFPLDRPLRILDALARARGLAVGLRDGRSSSIVDYDRSFLLRGQQRLNVDLRALIEAGDLRYNVQLHPGDLLHLPSAADAEVYLLGAVASQGPRPYSDGMTAIDLLTRGGGVLLRARRGLIVVVRGPLDRPDVYTIDIDNVLSARSPDFALAPGDLVYVPDRPDDYLRDLGLTAINLFITTIAGRLGGAAADRLGIGPDP